jgi:predicted alpha/beta-hydrolase family hydrolase
VIHPSELTIRLEATSTVTARVYAGGEPRIDAALILAHGAGAGQQSAFMTSCASALAGLGIDVITFNFLYAEQRRRVPDRRPALEACYTAVIEAVRREVESARRSLFIGGKSMGGRMATHVAASGQAGPLGGIVLLGYPLHPPGRPEERRDSHLPAITCPMFFVQGSRDSFGTPAELEPVLSTLPAATLHIVIGGDHSFKLAKADAGRQAAVFEDIQRSVVQWIRGLIEQKTEIAEVTD